MVMGYGTSLCGPAAGREQDGNRTGEGEVGAVDGMMCTDCLAFVGPEPIV